MDEVQKLKAEIRYWQRAYWGVVDDGLKEDFHKKVKETVAKHKKRQIKDPVQLSFLM